MRGVRCEATSSTATDSGSTSYRRSGTSRRTRSARPTSGGSWHGSGIWHRAPGTVASVLSIASGMLRYGVKAGAVERNVARDLDRDDRPSVKRETEPRYLTAAEVWLLIAELSDTFRPVAATCAYAGSASRRCSGSGGATSTSRPERSPSPAS